MNIRMAVVENNVDPLKVKRCQVRIFGLHTEDRTTYPTEDLPWALTLSESSNISGEGNFFIPNNGDYVIVSFLDKEEQKPIIIGVLPRIVTQLPDFNIGFSDPNQVNPNSDFVGESGLSRLARNEEIDKTIIQDKKDNRTTGVDCNGTIWDEPETPYNALYPNNKVIHTKNHVIELDDTDGVERLHLYHKSGTSKEIHPNGDEVNLIKAKRYIVVDSDNNLLVKGNYNCRIETNVNKEIVGDEKKKISGNVTNDINGNSTENISGNKQINTDGSIDLDASTSGSIQTGTSLVVNGGTTITITASGNISITSSGTVSITGTSISLN